MTLRKAGFVASPEEVICLPDVMQMDAQSLVEILQLPKACTSER